MKKNSWHYRLAKLANDDHHFYSDETSICAYIRKVVVGIGLVGFLAFLLITLVWYLGFAVWGTIGYIFGFAEFNFAAISLLCVLGFFGIVLLCAKASEYWKDKSEELLHEENVSLPASVYKSYKEKICFKVKFD